MKKNLFPLGMWLLFEAIAVILWLTLDNLFYLLNFSYIGTCLALGIFLYSHKVKYARNAVQWAIGLYMLLYLGLLSQENMQIEGFWYYLFLGVFEAAVIHYAVAKIFGPLLFGRGWCGYACWTAMVLDLLPYKPPLYPGKTSSGSGISSFWRRFCSWERCSGYRFPAWIASSSGALSSGTCFTTPPASRWPLPSGTTGLSANTSVPSPSF